MSSHELKHVIEAADREIMAEDFDALMDFYDEHATLVVKPGLNASGKEQIRKAFVAIAAYFNHTLKISQDKMKIIEGGDTALVIAEAVLNTAGVDGAVTSLVRRATYVFRKSADGKWLCLIYPTLRSSGAWSNARPFRKLTSELVMNGPKATSALSLICPQVRKLAGATGRAG